MNLKKINNFSFTFGKESRPGDYSVCKVNVIDECNENFWNGEFKISGTQMAIWKKKSLDKDLQKIMELVVKMHALNNSLPKKDPCIGVSSYDVVNLTLEDYVEFLEQQIDVLKKGKVLNYEEVKKLYRWTENDISQLKYSYKEKGADFASSGYSIYLFCLMDIWGSVFCEQFGKKGVIEENVGCFLKRLKNKFPESYIFENHEIPDLVNTTRNNLVHNYGLRVFISGRKEEWLNIDTIEEPVINPQETNNRPHINCIKLSDNMMTVIENWTKVNHPTILSKK